MSGRALLALALFLLSARAEGALALTLRSETKLSGSLADALDVRWADAETVILAGGKRGVFRYHVSSGQAEPILGSASPHGFFFSSRLGYSSSFLVPGSSFAALAWRRNLPGSALSPHFPFDMILDLDVYGDTLAVLGARRAKDGQWAPEGGIAWVGSLEKGLKDLRPIHYSESGSGAKALDRCHFFNTGAIGFLRDGSIVVVPGVEPGLYLYDRAGKLLKTWDSEPLGFHDRCELQEGESHAMGLAPTARWQYLNARTILDDVIPLPGGIGLFTRQFVRGKMHFTLSVVKDGGVDQRIALPFTGGERSFIRADVRGKRLALLLRIRNVEDARWCTTCRHGDAVRNASPSRCTFSLRHSRRSAQHMRWYGGTAYGPPPHPTTARRSSAPGCGAMTPLRNRWMPRNGVRYPLPLPRSSG